MSEPEDSVRSFRLPHGGFLITEPAPISGGVLGDLATPRGNEFFIIQPRPNDTRARMDRRAIARAVQLLYMLRRRAERGSRMGEHA